MIPKIIHYCWFGGNPLPDLAVKCISSWKKFFPDYKVIEWNERNFNIQENAYIFEAYKLGKYAFVSDFVRFYVLYKYGGLYFDTDVEVIKPMTDIIERGPFMGIQSPYHDSSEKVKQIDPMLGVAPGLGLGATPGLSLYRPLIDYYYCHHFLSFLGKMSPTIVSIVSELIKSRHFERLPGGAFLVDNEVYVYPEDYFCPLNYWTGKLVITNNTRSIHHYSSSWISNKKKSRIDIIVWHLRQIWVLLCSYIKFLW